MASLAAARAYRTPEEAVSLITPNNGWGKPSIWRSQSSVTCSNSVAAGEVRQSIALTFNALQSISPRMPGPEPVMLKYAMKPGEFQWVIRQYNVINIGQNGF